MFYSPRKVFMENVIEVPAEATTSDAVISSDVLKPFEASTFGKATVFVKGDKGEMSADDASLTAKVSYDEGETWVTAKTIAVEHGSFDFTTQEIAGIVPRIKFELDLGGMTLDAGHGLQVDVLIEEGSDNFGRYTHTDVIDVGTAVANPVTAEVLEGETLDISAVNPVSATAIFTADNTKLTADLNARMQSSWDGTNWWDLGSAVTEVAGESFKEISSADTDILGKYLRFNITVDETAGAIAEDHNINVDVVVFTRN